MRHWCKVESAEYLGKLRLRIAQKVAKSGDCLCWTASAVGGYGQIKVRNLNRLAHRVIWELERGPIPEGMDVLHRCDTPSCVNVEHLFLGSHKENMEDKASKSRAPSKLASSDIGPIRELIRSGQSLCSIARRYGVGHHTISDIRDGITWSHV